MPNHFRQRIREIEDLEDRLRLASFRFKFATAKLHYLRLRSQHFATDRFGTALCEGNTVEILTSTSASVHTGTIATLLECKSGYGANCWCTVRIWSGPKSGKTFSRKAKNLRKLITDY